MIQIPKRARKGANKGRRAKKPVVIGLPARWWVELGQAMLDQGLISVGSDRRYFMKEDKLELRLEKGTKIRADGRVFFPGRYYLATQNLEDLQHAA